MSVSRSNQIQFLIVEDSDLDAERVLRTFKRLKIPNKTHRAKDGIDALDLLRGAQGEILPNVPLIVLLDINMPRMNGLEFLREVRSDQALRDIPVFVFTTSERPDDVDTSHQLNVCGYIVKPLHSAEMTHAFETLSRFWALCKYPRAAAW